MWLSGFAKHPILIQAPPPMLGLLMAQEPLIDMDLSRSGSTGLEEAVIKNWQVMQVLKDFFFLDK